MAKNELTKNDWLRIVLTVLLSLTLVFSLFSATACKKKNSSGTDSESDVKEEATLPDDDQTILNGNFEIVYSNATYPVTSIQSWTKSYASTTNGSGTNPTSTYTSGIVNTLDIDKIEFSTNAEEQLTALKNINLSTRYGENTDETNSRVLMLTNKYKNTSTNGIGTAQKAKSSSTITVAAGQAAIISVWVRTDGFYDSDNATNKNLKDYWGNDVSGDKGAYIMLTNAVNSSTVAPMYIKGINTCGEWKQYSFIVKGNLHTSSTVNLSLGLGFGDVNNVAEYVQGYAFFDDITCETIPVDKAYTYTDKDNNTVTVKEYDAYRAQSVNEVSLYDGDEIKPSTDILVIDANTTTGSTALTNIAESGKPANMAICLDMSVAANPATVLDTLESDKLNVSLTSDDNGTAPSYSENDGLSGLKLLSELKSDSDTLVSDFFAKYPFDNTAATKVLMLRLKKQSALQAVLSGNSYMNYLGNNVTAYGKVQKNTYTKISFKVKTTKFYNVTGLGISIIDKGDGTISEENYVNTDFTDIDTTKSVSDPDYFDGWKTYTFYISNTTETDKFFDIKINLGITTISSNAVFTSGFAGITCFEFDDNIAESIYNSVSSSDSKVKKVTLNAGYNTYNSDSGFDTVSSGDKYLPNGEEKIKTSSVQPSNYIGVNANSAYVGGTNTASYNDYHNSNVTSGLVSSLYKANYSSWLNADMFDSTLTSSQPLAIAIGSGDATSFGYVSKSSNSLNASSYYSISLRVNVSANAKANIYLTKYNPSEDNRYGIYGLSNLSEDRLNSDYTNDFESSKLCYTVNSTNGAWVYVTFYIVTGDNAANYRIELWNGTRDGSANVQNGIVMFDKLTINSSFDSATYDELVEKYADTTVYTNTKLYTQKPWDSDDQDVKYTEKVVYACDTTTNTMFMNFSNIDVNEPNDTEETTDSETDNTNETPSKPKTDVWLLVSSLVLAIALIASLILVFIKKFRENIKKKRKEYNAHYTAKKRHYVKKNVEKLDVNSDDDTLSDENSESDEKEDK